jgi:hypothetical protein
MELLNNIVSSIGSTVILITRHFKSLDDFVIKSDEENIDILLKNPKDKVKFQHAIDDLLKDNQKSKTLEINDKQITISI